MTDINTFIEKVGRGEIAALGLREQEISRAKRDGVFPSGWYLSLKGLADRKGVELPPHLIKWSKKAAPVEGVCARSGGR